MRDLNATPRFDAGRKRERDAQWCGFVQGSCNQEIFRKLIPAKPKNEIAITVSNVPPGDYRLRLCTVGFEKNDAYSAYLKLGAPSQLTREQEKELRAAAAGQTALDIEVTIGSDGRFAKTLPLCENDVILLKLDHR